jgi:hypothetical protein
MSVDLPAAIAMYIAEENRGDSETMAECDLVACLLS